MSFQVVIVTGAASGIGAAIALRFAEQHAGLCITDINEQDLHKVGTECQKLSKTKVLEIAADITKDEDQENIVKCALKEFGKIDVLVNCAGIFEFTNLKDSDIMKKFDKIIAINLRSFVSMTNKTLPALTESKGCVINISSISSTYIFKKSLVYSMAKAGVTTFTKHAALELASLGVRVNCISPSPVKTNILKNTGISDYEQQEIWDNTVEVTPLNKLLKREEIAELTVYLASDKAASITGTDIVIDAGMTLGR